LNGGTQAVIVRIAKGAAEASVTLSNDAATPVPVLTLKARGAGTDENTLHVSVDSQTADPERTFNLTIFREVVDASGNATTTEQEVLRNLSFDPQSGRFV